MPWGTAPPRGELSNSGLRSTKLLDVHALPEGDSAWGLRQMLGNVWEWTSTTFYPYPGYVMDCLDTGNLSKFCQNFVKISSNFSKISINFCHPI